MNISAMYLAYLLAGCWVSGAITTAEFLNGESKRPLSLVALVTFLIWWVFAYQFGRHVITHVRKNR
jgi:hypothetical protein